MIHLFVHFFLQKENKGLPLPLNQIKHLGRQIIEAFIFLRKDVGIIYADVQPDDLHFPVGTKYTTIISEEYASSLKVLSKRLEPMSAPFIERWINVSDWKLF